MTRHRVLREAEFDPAVKKYWLSYTVLVLVVCVVGIPLIPVFLIVGFWLTERYLSRMQCQLTDRSLFFRKGILNRVERTVPLDMITDVALKQGPLMRMFGITALAVETAGQSSTPGGALVQIAGVVDASDFREAVLEQRDELVESRAGRRGGSEGAAPTGETTGAPASAPIGAADATRLLTEIRDSLGRIETRLIERGP